MSAKQRQKMADVATDIATRYLWRRRLRLSSMASQPKIGGSKDPLNPQVPQLVCHGANGGRRDDGREQDFGVGVRCQLLYSAKELDQNQTVTTELVESGVEGKHLGIDVQTVGPDLVDGALHFI